MTSPKQKSATVHRTNRTKYTKVDIMRNKFFDEDDLIDYEEHFTDVYDHSDYEEGFLPRDDGMLEWVEMMEYDEMMEYMQQVRDAIYPVQRPGEEMLNVLEEQLFDVERTAAILKNRDVQEKQAAKREKEKKRLADKKAREKVEDKARRAMEDSGWTFDFAQMNLVAPMPQLKPKLDLKKEIANSKLKPKINFVVIGHVDAGKSTLMGRVLLDTKVINSRTVDKYKKEATDLGKESFHLAWVLDQTDEERRRGVTIDVCTTSFDTPSTQFTILDAPGHKDFVPNMIAGSSQADVAVLVIDGSMGNFESGFMLQGQTKEHAILTRSMGINNLVVAINKLDTVEGHDGGSQGRFNYIVSELSPFLKKIGFASTDISYVPVSGLHGHNVVFKAKDALKWYTGKPLLEVLEGIKVQDIASESELPFRITVQSVFPGSNTSVIYVQGRIEAGAIQVGNSCVIASSQSIVKIKTISVNEKPAQWAKTGDIVTMGLVGIETVEEVRKTDVLCPPEHMISMVQKFEARIACFDMKRPIVKGTQVIFHRNNISAPATITKLVSVTKAAESEDTENTEELKPRFVSSNQSAIIQVKLDDGPVPMELHKNNKSLGLVILRMAGATIAAGAVEKIVRYKPKRVEEKAKDYSHKKGPLADPDIH